MNDKPQYRLDRNSFSAQTLQEANDHYRFWKNKSQKERLNAAFYLISQCYNVLPSTKIERTVFSKRKHG